MFRITALFLSLVFIGGCVVNPVTGENELSVLSPAQEIQMGKQYYGPYQQQQGGEYTVDPKLSAYISKVGNSLAAVSDNPSLPYEFVVLNNDVPNAWALPGGKIAINRGLLVLLDDEAQLAAVLGHEVVHAAARHAARQMTQQTLLGIGVNAVGLAAQESDASQWINMGTGIAANAWQARYGREQELQSDKVGMRYMVAAGYEPQGAVELQQTFVELSKGQQSNLLSALFASHPPSQTRVDRNRELAQTMSSGARNAKQYQAAIAQIKADQGAYDLQQKSMASAQAKKYDEAISLIDQAINLQKKEALFYITKGQILNAQKNSKAARQAFQSALKINPNYFMSSLGLALTEWQLDDKQSAKGHFEQSMVLLPTQIASYRLGEIALSENQRDKAIEYFQFAAQGGGEIGQAAQEKLTALQQ